MRALFLIESVKMGAKVVNAINARELHERLHSKQDFSTWIKKRLEVCGAREGADYLLIPFDVAQKEIKVRNGKIYAINTFDGLFVKQCFIKDEIIELRSFNQNYQPLFYPLNEVAILGRIRGVINKV